MAKAWVYQDDKQVEKHGEDKANWYVGRVDPGGKRRGKSCGPGLEGSRNAEKLRKRLEAELTTGTYEDTSRATWDEFRKRCAEFVLAGMGDGNRRETNIAISHFERLTKMKKIASVCSNDISSCVAKRRKEAGVRKGTLTSPATINKELRHLRAVFRKAKKLGYLAAAPDFDFLKEPKKLPVWIPPEHLAAMYRACEEAVQRPIGLPYPAADWWRGVMIFGYMTGWRIGSILSLRREDVDLDAGTAVSLAEDNKGGRDQVISLPPLAVEHLKRVPSFAPRVLSVAARQAPTVRRLRGNSGRGGGEAGAGEDPLWLPRPAPRLRHSQRGATVCRRSPGADAAPMLHDHAAIHRPRTANASCGE